MKIINAIHAQSIGGVDQVFRDYTAVLAKHGHEVSLLISDNGQDSYQDDNIKKIFKLKNSAQIIDFFHLLLILIINQPDIIICHSRRLMSWSKSLKFFRKIGLIKTKSIAVNHGISFHKSLCCDYVISINEEICKMVVDQGFDKDKSFVLKNAININQTYHEKTLNNPPVIGIYGRIEPRKGFDVLLQACALLDKKGQDFRIKIGGFSTGGDDWGWKYINLYLEENNLFPKANKVGVVVDKQDFFKDVDIFCVPSREEPFGLVILEGMLHSTLVISSDTVGGKLLISNNENGLLFANENSEALAEKIMQVLNNPSDYNQITKNAFLRLEKEFSFDSLSRVMSEILQKVSTDA